MDQASIVSGTFFAGLGTIVALVLLVYSIAYVYDRCAGSYDNMLTPQELEERRIASTIIRRAGLGGILKEERNRAIRHFFDKTSYKYQKIETDENDVEAQKNDEPKIDDTENETNDTKESDKENDEIQDDSKENTKEGVLEEGNEESLDEVAEGTCPICLTEYEDGEKVITGSNCSHMFHYECCMQWMEKGKDECPCCRKDMMEPDDLVTAAREVLGEQRVTKLKTINEDAARRLNAILAAEAAQEEEEASNAAPSSRSRAPNTVHRAPSMWQGISRVSRQREAERTTA